MEFRVFNVKYVALASIVDNVNIKVDQKLLHLSAVNLFYFTV